MSTASSKTSSRKITTHEIRRVSAYENALKVDLVVLVEVGVLGSERLPLGVGLVGGREVIGACLLVAVLPDVLPALLELPPLRAAALPPAAHLRRAAPRLASVDAEAKATRSRFFAF